MSFDRISSFVNVKSIILAFSFFYFGILIIPQTLYFSHRFIVGWFYAFPIVIIILVLIAAWDGIGKNNYLGVIGFSFIWLCIAILLACGTQYVYLHKEFNSSAWKDDASDGHMSPRLLSLRQRMVNDLAKDILPHTTRNDIELLLGTPDDMPFGNIVYVLGYVLPLERSKEMQCLEIKYNLDGSFKGYRVWNGCYG